MLGLKFEFRVSSLWIIHSKVMSEVYKSKFGEHISIHIH